MFRKILATAAFALLGTNAASAATFTYTSQPLQVGSEGGTGATQVSIVFAGDLPLPGKCVVTQKLKKYDDGAHTIRSLKKDGYTLVKTIVNEDKRIKVTYANVCLGRDGVTVNGQYQVYFTYSNNVVYANFYANNLGYTVPGDLVELDLYLGGEVPQIYSNYSDTQGTWTITP